MKQFQIKNGKYNVVEKFKLNKDVQLIVTKKSTKLKKYNSKFCSPNRSDPKKSSLLSMSNL